MELSLPTFRLDAPASLSLSLTYIHMLANTTHILMLHEYAKSFYLARHRLIVVRWVDVCYDYYYYHHLTLKMAGASSRNVGRLSSTKS